jgi:hypothetical protein
MIQMQSVHNRKYLLLTVLFIPVFFSCAATEEKGAHEFIGNYGKHAPSPSHFSICYSHGCNRSADVQLTAEEWDMIRQIFDPGPSDASTERQSIAKAVGSLEMIVGRRTGTDADLGGSFAGTFRQYQMDCVDEAVNTTTYLLMMKNDGLIRFHDLREPANRGYFIWGGWPHTAPVIVERLSGKEYAVDSWFQDNGQPPFIIPLEQWKDGWRPPPGKP